MANDLTATVQQILGHLNEFIKIPVGISNKHMHLAEHDFQQLFPGECLTIKKTLNQPGEFAANQVVSVVGPKGKIDNIRILGPFRKQSQVELALTDARTLGLKVPIRLSGDLADTPAITLQTPKGQVMLSEGAIVAKRHIHMSPTDEALLRVENGESVAVELNSAERKTIFDDCIIRIGEKYKLEMHIDTDEANASGTTPQLFAKIITKK